MKHVIGIDPSLTGTAVAALRKDGAYTLQSFGSEPPPVASVRGTVARLEDLANRVAMWMKSLDGLAMVIIEGYSHGSKHQAHQLGEYGGILRSILCKTFTRDCIIIEAPPKTLKQFACNNGGAGKLAIAVALARRYDIDFGNDDNKYDAFGLVQLGACVVGWNKPANEGQRKAVATIQAMDKKE